jgi:hypothetical protein
VKTFNPYAIILQYGIGMSTKKNERKYPGETFAARFFGTIFATAFPHQRGVFSFYSHWGVVPLKRGGGIKTISHPK